MECQMEKLEQPVKDNEKLLRKYEWNMQDFWDTFKRSTIWVMGIEEGEEIQTR
jgi:hypothetical protein